MKHDGQIEHQVAMDEDAPFLENSDGQKRPKWMQQHKTPTSNRTIRRVALLLLLPAAVFLVLLAWDPPASRHGHWPLHPHHRHGHGHGHGHRPGHGPGLPRPPPHRHPTPVQCQVISSATPTLNLSLDPILAHDPRKPGPTDLPPHPPHRPAYGGRRPRDKGRPCTGMGPNEIPSFGPHPHPPPPFGPRPGIFLHPSLSGAHSVAILRSKPVQPPPNPPAPPKDDKPVDSERSDTDTKPPRPEPVQAQITFRRSDDEPDMIDIQRMVNLAQHGDKAAEAAEKALPELHVCIMHGSPGSVGLAVFPQDPVKNLPTPGQDSTDGGRKEDAHVKPHHGPKHHPPPPFPGPPALDPDFETLVQKLDVKLHLPTHFPPAGVDLSFGPPFAPPPPPPPARI